MTRNRMRLLCLGMMILAGASPVVGQTTTRISLGRNGEDTQGRSFHPAMSADGRFVAFHSSSTNLIDEDTVGYQIFLADRWTDEISLISTNTGGQEGNESSQNAAMSSDGRFVVFNSDASDLVAGDTNGESDVFLHDRQTGVTSRISVNSDGTEANGWSRYPTISADGRFVAFESLATNLVPADTNDQWDVFLRDTVLGITTRVSVSSSGQQGDGASNGACLSGDGTLIGFSSDATNLAIGDTNGWKDCFVHDPLTGATERVSVSAGGVQGDDRSLDISLSYDGSLIAFESEASTLIDDDTNGRDDIYVRDMTTDEVQRVSVDSFGRELSWYSGDPRISADGSTIAFSTRADELDGANGEIQVYVHRLRTGETLLVSRNDQGESGDQRSTVSAISVDGQHVAYQSEASNLVSGDANGEEDIYFLQDVVYSPWVNLGFGLAGSTQPRLFIDGALAADFEVQFKLEDGLGNSSGFVVTGFSRIDGKAFGGTLVPLPDIIQMIQLDALGRWEATLVCPPDLPTGLDVWVQLLVTDPLAPKGLSFSNARTTTSQ